MKKLFLVMILIVLSGCDKKEALPTELDVAQPPTPTNFQIVQSAYLEYDLSWDISDPGNRVKEYRVYAYSAISMPEVVGSTIDLFFLAGSAVELPGLMFAVSAVTVENIESDPVSAAAPDTVLTASSYRR